MIAGDVALNLSSNVSQWMLSSAFDGPGASSATLGDGLTTNAMNRARFDFDGGGDHVDLDLLADLGPLDGPAELFGDANLGTTSEPAQNPAASAALRITSPLLVGDDEGGAIDVTALVAPKAMFAGEYASRVASNAGVRLGDSMRVASSTTQREAVERSASDAEALRARAVVFEVALASDADADADQRARVDRPAATRDGARAPAAPARRGDQDTTQATPVRAVEAIANGAESVDAQSESASADRVSGTEGASRSGDASKGRAAAHDAALGELGGSAESRLAVDIDVAATRQQTVGLAFALVAGAAPLIKFKRARRARPTRLAEQSSGVTS